LLRFWLADPEHKDKAFIISTKHVVRKILPSAGYRYFEAIFQEMADELDLDALLL
jgi:hypothetical protein